MSAFLLKPPKRSNLSGDLAILDLKSDVFYFCFSLNSLILLNFSFILDSLKESTLEGDFERVLLGDLSRGFPFVVNMSRTLTVSSAVYLLWVSTIHKMVSTYVFCL